MPVSQQDNVNFSAERQMKGFPFVSLPNVSEDASYSGGISLKVNDMSKPSCRRLTFVIT